MTESHVVDITELATLGEQFPLHLMRLGFRLLQTMDRAGHDQFRVIVPPVCDVPAGPFLMGSDKQYDPDARDEELPQHAVTVLAFQIGVFPLMVREYACAVEAGAVSEPEGEIRWQHQLQQADHPVVCLSWFQARDYASFLTQVTGDHWRLPTEAEWEKAARGTDGRIYPWGNRWNPTRANTLNGGPVTTKPVGSYPRGMSPYGAQDMAGNVLEWTSSTPKAYPYQADDGREDLSDQTGKVLRGGGWGNYQPGVRAAYRSDYPPASNLNDFGVRLVLGGSA